MLLWTTLLCLLSANLVVSQFAKPGVLADSDPSTLLQPLKGFLKKKDLSEDLHLIRSLLRSRQSGCPTGYGQCTDFPDTCCPADGSCCQPGACCQAGFFCYGDGCCPNGASGCETNSCCQPTETCCSGGGCCPSGFYCTTVDGIPGCCPNGTTCTSIDNPQCADPTYVVCPGEDFCCPPGDMCYRDNVGNPQCSPGPSSIPPSLTTSTPPITGSSNSSRMSLNSSSSTSKRSTSSTKSPLTVPLFPKTSSSSTSSRTPTPTPIRNSDSSSGITSSAVSVVFDGILASFATIGAFVYLF